MLSCLINLTVFLLVEATWSQWTEGECSVSCDEGTRNRHRECLPGKHTVDNRTCIGSAVEAISCKERMCPGIMIIKIIAKYFNTLLRKE